MSKVLEVHLDSATLTMGPVAPEEARRFRRWCAGQYADLVASLADEINLSLDVRGAICVFRADGLDETTRTTVEREFASISQGASAAGFKWSGPG